VNIDEKINNTLNNLEAASLDLKRYAIFTDLSEQVEQICKEVEERKKIIEPKPTS